LTGFGQGGDSADTGGRAEATGRSDSVDAADQLARPGQQFNGEQGLANRPGSLVGKNAFETRVAFVHIIANCQVRMGALDLPGSRSSV